MEMSVFDRGNLEVGILENHSHARVLGAEQLCCRNAPGAIAYSDFRIDGEELQQSVNARHRTGRPVDVHDLGWIAAVIQPRHQAAETAGMIAVRMRDEDVAD